MERTRIQALAFAFVLVTSMTLAPLAGVGAVGTATAQDETQVRTCDDPVSIAVGAIVGFGKGGFDGATSEENPCIKTENIADADTVEEAKRIISQEALEDKRYFESYETQFDSYSGEIQNPAYSDARITFVEAVANGSDRVEAVTEARRAAHARTASQQRELWVYYSSLANSMATLESKAEDKGIRQESIRIGYVNESSYFETGYSFQSNATENITVTNGSKISVPAASKNGDTINPLSEDLLVQVFNPETKNWDSIIGTVNSYSSTGSYDLQNGVTKKFELGTQPPSGTLAINDETGTQVGRLVVNNEGAPTLELHHGSSTMRWTEFDTATPTEIAVTANDGSVTVDFETTGQGDLTTPYQISSNASEVVLSNAETKLSDTWSRQGGITSTSHPFTQKHQHLEQVDNDVTTGLGNSSSGYLSDVYDAYEGGEINITESLWSYDRVRMAPDEMASTATQNLARERLGLGRSDSGSSASVTVHKGAVVNGKTLESNTTYDTATLWATSPPPNQSWKTNTTYSVSDVGGLAGLNYEATNSYTENGSVKYEVVTRMANIESGTFTVNSLTTSDGQSVTVIEHDDNNPQSTNVTDLNKQISELEEAINLYRDQLEDENAGIGGGGGGGGGIDFSLPGLGWSFSLPWDSMAISLGGIGMVVAAGAVVLFVMGPTGRIVALIWKLSSSGGKAAEKVAGVTDARRRGMERFRER